MTGRSFGQVLIPTVLSPKSYGRIPLALSVHFAVIGLLCLTYVTRYWPSLGH